MYPTRLSQFGQKTPFRNNINRIQGYIKTILSHAALEEVLGNRPVSYTHLDVYKRQVVRKSRYSVHACGRSERFSCYVLYILFKRF